MSKFSPFFADLGLLGAVTLVTPVGPLAVVVVASERPDASELPAPGTVVAAGFCSVADLLQRAGVGEGTVPEALEADVAAVRGAVTAYFGGEVGALDAVPVAQVGGPFRSLAWEALRRVPAGLTVTYSELAASAGNDRAVRAAGSACAVNLVAPFVPCHRVVRGDGSLGGYAFGVPVKEFLLQFEASAAGKLDNY